MYDVRLELRADAAFRSLPPSDAVDVLQKLDVIEKLGVVREQQIGSVNGVYFVHLMYAAGYNIVSISRTGTTKISVTDIVPFSIMNHARKTKLVQDAAGQIGVFIQAVKTS